jgi:hypothetical protein
MAKEKYDGVVEAVHYNREGQVEWVRAFERRGPTFSDQVLIDRNVLIERLKSGKNYMVGKRVPRLASTFDLSVPMRVMNVNGRDILVAGNRQTEQDHLEGVPKI